MNKRRSVQNSRNCHGQALLEWVMGSLWVCGALVACAFIVIDISLIVLYKEKLAVVTNSAAQFAMEQGIQKHEKTKPYVLSLLATLGLPTNDVDIRVSDCLIANERGVEVNVKLNKLPLPGCSILPNLVALSDTGAAVDAAPGFGGMRSVGSGLSSGVYGPKGELALFAMANWDGKLPVWEMEGGQLYQKVK